MMSLLYDIRILLCRTDVKNNIPVLEIMFCILKKWGCCFDENYL